MMASTFVFDQHSELQCKEVLIKLLNNNRNINYNKFMSCLQCNLVRMFEELRGEVDMFGQPTPLALKTMEELPQEEELFEEEELLEEEEEQINEAQMVASSIEVLPSSKQKEVFDSLPLSVMRQSTNEMSVERSKQLYAQNTKVGVYQKHEEKKYVVTVSAQFPSKSRKEKWMRYKNETRDIIKGIERQYSKGSGFLKFTLVSTRCVLAPEYTEILEDIKRRLENEEHLGCQSYSEPNLSGGSLGGKRKPGSDGTDQNLEGSTLKKRKLDGGCTDDQADRPTLIECIRFQGRERRINIPQEIGVKYRDFGLFILDDPNGVRIRALAHKHNNDANEINIEIIEEWVAGKGKRPVTWKTLTEVLHDIELLTLTEEIEAVKS